MTTTEDNIAATRELSSWLLHAVPMPRGAREWHHSPTAHYRHGSLGIGPADGSFTRTTWWTVSLSADALGSWLRTHAPEGLTPDTGTGGSVESEGVWEHDQDFRVQSTSAHTRGWVNFAFTADGDHLVVRVDTFVGARFARTVLVPDDAISVTIVRTETSHRPNAEPHTIVRTVSDAPAVTYLVKLVNGLPGAMTTEFVAPCPASLEERSYRLTFATPNGAYVASLPTTMCWPSVALVHDGAKAGPALDPGRHFTKVIDRYLS